MGKPAHAKTNTKTKKKGVLLPSILVFFATFCVLGLRWTFTQWDELAVNEILFTLRALQGTGNNMIESFMLQVIVPAFIAAIVVGLILLALRRKGIFTKLRPILSALCAIAIVGSLAYLWHGIGLTEYLLHIQSNKDFIAENYVEPAEVDIQFPEQKRNLIFLYLESMETTYADKAHGGSFDTSYIPELTEIALEGESFSGKKGELNGGYSMPDTTWTTGAMVAQTSGLPLKIPIDGNGMNNQEAFFPEATALGDVLADEGYEQVLFIGSDAAFGARELWFKTHRDYLMHDYLYAKEQKWIPQDYAEWWGFEDEKLYDFAKDELTALAKQDKPFNFTMLTADTHFPAGYTCHLCKNDFESEYGNVLACASRQAADFIHWCQEQDFYENTTIVVVGDHPTMDSGFVPLIDPDYSRRVYTAFLNTPEGVKATGEDRIYTTFDIFPTTLAALGATIEGNKLALGTNLYSSTPTLTEEVGLEEERDQLKYPSDFMDEMAAISEDILVMQEQFAWKDVKVSCTPGANNTFTVEAEINADDAKRMNALHIYLSPVDGGDTLEYILQETGDGTFEKEVSMDDFGHYGAYNYQLKAKTDAGLMDYGGTGVINPT